MKKFSPESRPLNSKSREHLMLADYDYELPKEKIAMHPLQDRPAAKMLVLDHKSEKMEQKPFDNLRDPPSHPGDECRAAAACVRPFEERHQNHSLQT